MFKLYALRSIAHTRTKHAETVLTGVHIEGCIEAAIERESHLFVAAAGNVVGSDNKCGLDPWPPSPLTNMDPLDSDSGEDEPPPPAGGSGSTKPPPGMAEKTRKRKRAGECRKEKHIHLATSSLLPDQYAAKPCMLVGRLKASDTVKLGGNALNLPTTSGRSWIGKKQAGIREEPWELDVLQQLKFKYIEWDRM